MLHISFNSIAQNDTERQKILDTLQLKTLLVDTVVHPIYGITQSYELDTLLTRELALTHQEFVKHLKDDMGFVQYDSLALEKTRVVPPNKHGLPSNKVIHIYMLYYKGVPLYNHKIRIKQFKEIITVVNIPKEIPLNLEGLDVEPKLSHEVAIEIALNKANLRTYIWDKYANRAEDNNGNLVDKETLKKKLLQKEIYLYVPHKEDIISLVYKNNQIIYH